MAMSKIQLMGMLGVLAVTNVMVQSSCVQLDSTLLSSCPCDDATLTFTVEGQTSIASNTVNLALVLDGSGSISSSNFALEQDFAEDTVAAFAARNLFDNGGMASYVQFSSRLASSGTFGSEKAFNAFVDADKQSRGGTATSIGINEGARLLSINPADANIMIVITDGRSSNIIATSIAAARARAKGITMFAVGVGSGTNGFELLGIAGNKNNIFEVAQFAKLNAALQSILSSSGGIVVPCKATGAAVTIEFSVPVTFPPSKLASNKIVTSSAADLESNPTDFKVMMDVCSEGAGAGIVVSADYNDDQGNTPDLSSLTGLVIGNDFCALPTPAPTAAPTPAPTPAPTKAPTSPTGGNLNVGQATDSKYSGCFNPGNKKAPLDGPMNTWSEMTTQACADICNCWGWEYFATMRGSECHCGSRVPLTNRMIGKCDYACTGDSSIACGGAGSISLYMSTKFGNP